MVEVLTLSVLLLGAGSEATAQLAHLDGSPLTPAAVRSAEEPETVKRVTAGAVSGDTIVDLRRGDRLVVRDLSGELTVEVWDQDRMEVRLSDEDDEIRVERAGGVVRLIPAGRRGRAGRVEVLVRVPAWVDVEVGGRSLDVRVRGLSGRVSVESMSGDIDVRESTGEVRVRTQQGDVFVTDVSGDVSVSSQGDDVTLTRVSGAVEAHSGSGEIRLEESSSMSVRAETQDGDVEFSGIVAEGGRYGFFVHDGDVTVEMQESVSVSVEISTFDAEFTSDFPVVVQRLRGGKEFDFVLGGGSAELRIEVFDGEINLLKRR